LANGVPSYTDATSLFNFNTPGSTFGGTPIAAVNGGVLYFQFTPVPVPEPTFILFACGAGAGAMGWWKRRRAAATA
jgi:hypothetical protein